MRSTVLLLALVLVACGGEDRALHPRVRVGTFDIDGAPPADLVLLSQAEVVATPRPMRPVDGEPGLYEVPGASMGAFRVEGPSGWGSLRIDVMLPELREEGPPPYVHLGAPKTLYIESSFPDYRPGLLWSAERVGGDRRSPIDVDVEIVSGGRFVALRFAEETWQGEFALTGHLARGSAERMSAQEAAGGPLSDPLGIAIREKDRPAFVRVGPAPTSTLQVGLVAAGEKAAPSGVVLEATFPGLPLPFRAEGKSEKGVVRLPKLALLDRPLALRVGAGPTAHEITADERRDLETHYLLSADQAEGRAVRIPRVGERPLTRVLFRPAGATAYGLVPLDTGGAALLPRSEGRLLIEAGGWWGETALDAEAMAVAEVPFAEAVRVEGRIDGWTTGTIGALRFYRHEGADRITGHALAYRIAAQGTFSCRLPPGTYDVEVSSPRGIWRRPTPLGATKGGAHVHTTLRAP